ncbi:hypothetical protein U7537_04660 [Lacticaseibacillus rhamnosus]
MNFPKTRYFKATSNFKAEGRIYLKGEIYPAYLMEDTEGYGKAERFYYMTAENGQFNFGNNLLDRLPDEWDMVEVDANGVEK